MSEDVETFVLTQRDGNGRELTLEQYGRQLVCVTPDSEEHLTPKRAWYLADVTDAMVDSGAILSGATPFIDALRSFAREYADPEMTEVIEA